MELVLSTCGPEQFPCDSGQCVPQGKRCDQKPDCSDKTDERYCKFISLLPEHHEVSPPPINGDTFALRFSLEITSVRDFDLASFKIGLDMILRMEWRDRRITFSNLRHGINNIKVGDKVKAIRLVHTGFCIFVQKWFYGRPGSPWQAQVGIHPLLVDVGVFLSRVQPNLGLRSSSLSPATGVRRRSCKAARHSCWWGVNTLHWRTTWAVPPKVHGEPGLPLQTYRSITCPMTITCSERRMNSHLMSDLWIALSDEVFDGADNSLISEWPTSVTLNCQFKLQMYPFDIQTCPFVYYFSNVVNFSFIVVNSLSCVSCKVLQLTWDAVYDNKKSNICNLVA